MVVFFRLRTRNVINRFFYVQRLTLKTKYHVSYNSQFARFRSTLR